MNLKKTSVAIFSALLLASCGSKSNEEQVQQQPEAYPTEVVNKQNATLETTFPVTIKGQEDIDIKPRIDGNILQIYVDEGSVVRKGQPLFKIDSPSTQQSLTSAEASVQNAQAQVNTGRVNVDRFRPLAEKGIVSNTQLQTYENALASSEAALRQAQASLTNARAMMSWTTVTSPVDGVVGTIPFRLGSLVNSSSVLTTVANINNVYAYFSMNEKELMGFLHDVDGRTQAEKIKNLPPVSLTLADGTMYEEKGKIETISGVVDVTTGSVNLRASFPNKAGVLRSGSSGRITIPKIMEDIFIIPQKSTFAQQDKVLVYKVQGDSVVQNIISVESLPDGKRYVVTSGLTEGDRIVTDGVATLKPGMKISAQ
ncbi:MAG: efflux RND transporter periplasmic adaptor subunit [Dysgonomonas sp.]|nr:efflux RND transporter periplasmic adaptor subunit [Dysgonomonas sp.]